MKSKIRFLVVAAILGGCHGDELAAQRTRIAELEGQLAAVQMKFNEADRLWQEEIKKKVRYKFDRMETFSKRAQGRVVIREQWQKDNLAKLDDAVRRNVYPEYEADRIINSIFRNIQRLGGFYVETFKYSPTDDSNLIEDPVRDIQVMKSLMWEGAKRSAHPDETFAEGLAYQFGDEEGAVINKIDFVALRKAPLPESTLPEWLKKK